MSNLKKRRVNMGKKGNLTLISGSSGVGKNTVIAQLLEENKDLKLLKSCTSRAIREDDKLQEDGKYAYEFLTKEEFEDKIAKGEMLEYDIFSDNYYGISSEVINDMLKSCKSIIKDITVKGVLSCREKLGKSVNIVSIFLTLQKSKLQQRLVQRNTKDIKNRMKHYSFEQKSIPLYDYCIYNDDLEATLAKLRAILNHFNNSEYLIAGENLKKFNENKIEKIASRLKRNKKVKPIKVAEKDGKIYIVSGINRYLASVRTNINVTKVFVDGVEPQQVDVAYWNEMIARQL